jgi:hypothetical protein
MAEDRVNVECPCCGNKLVVDASTGDILSEDRPKPKPSKSFEDALGDVRSGAQRREDAFAKAFDQTKRLEDVLEKKFEEAKKKADKDKTSKPRSPFDFD